MQALNALITLEKYEAGTHDELMHPDKIGGYEMGTWDYVGYLEGFRKITGKTIKADWKTGKNGFSIGHIFTAQEQAKISEYLSEKINKPKKSGGKFIVELNVDKSFILDCRLFMKWAMKLLQLFSSKNKIIWYCA